MNIVLLTQYYRPEMGAPQNRLYEMMAGLKENGCNLTIVTGMPNYPYGKIFPEYKGKFHVKEQVDGIPCARYWLYASNSKNKLSRILNMLSFSFTALFSFFYLRKKGVRYLIVESPPLTLGYTGYLLSKWLGARLIMNISDLWPLSAKELGVMTSSSMSYRMLAKLEGFLYRKAVFCMGQSGEIVEYIKDQGASKVYLFRNGVDPGRFHQVRSALDEAPRLPLKIVYAGLLGFAQGILDICKKVRFGSLEAEFHIYGAGGEQKELEAWLAGHPDSHICYHGSVAREEIPAILAQADVTLIPLVTSIFGAVPSKIYESMAAGLPILFSGDGEGRKIIEENDLGWASGPKDYAALEENIRFLTQNIQEITEKSENCIRCAREKFNRPKQVKELHNYIVSLP